MTEIHQDVILIVIIIITNVSMLTVRSSLRMQCIMAHYEQTMTTVYFCSNLTAHVILNLQQSDSCPEQLITVSKEKVAWIFIDYVYKSTCGDHWKHYTTEILKTKSTGHNTLHTGFGGKRKKE